MQERTGSPHYTSGLFAPGTVMIQPAAYIRGRVGNLAGQISVFENSPATGFERETGQRLAGQHRPRAGISTGRVILANNGHLESFGFYQRRLMHICLYASITERLTPEQINALGGTPRWSVTPARSRWAPRSGASRAVTAIGS